MIAPINTPKIEPIIAPSTGVTNAPLMAPPIPPIMPPVIPHFDAPYFFAVRAIIKYSRNSTNITITKSVNTNDNENESKLVKMPYTKELTAIKMFPGTPKKFENKAADTAKTNIISKITFLNIPFTEI